MIDSTFKHFVPIRLNSDGTVSVTSRIIQLSDLSPGIVEHREKSMSFPTERRQMFQKFSPFRTEIHKPYFLYQSIAR